MKSAVGRIVFGKNPWRTLLRTAVLAVVCVIVFKFMFRPAWTDGRSMEPTVHDGRLQFINLLAYRFGEPQRFDIVAVSHRGDNGRKFMYLKRILARPGERVAFEEGALIVDGVSLEEPYVEYDGRWRMEETELASDEYFVAGDNRDQPMRYHTAGITKRRYIVGRLL